MNRNANIRPAAGLKAGADIHVVAPNFKSRLSGVTSTIIALVPVQRRTVNIVTTGPGLPADLPHVPVASLPGLLRTPPAGVPVRIWHARRNVEMVAGLLARDVLRAPVRVVFTSAAQRRHKPFTRFLIRRMDAVIATSAAAAAYLERPATVIRHGVDIDTFRPMNAAEPDRAARQGSPAVSGATPAWVGCFGRIRPNKGTDLFVEAMIEVMGRHRDIQAVILGRVTSDQSGFAAQLRQRIDTAGLANRFHMPGEVARADVLSWYRRLSLYVAPQRWEGFGLTPLEAMASGVPVVATRAGAFAEIITKPEVGRLVDTDNGPALTKAVADLLSDRERLAAMGRSARDHVVAHFRLDDEAAAINAVYGDLWAGEGAPTDTGPV